MTWPTSDIDTTHADAGTDSPSLWRAAALALSQAFNQVRNHVSTYMQTVLEAANAGAARTALGFTTVGSNVATAADAAAARSAIGAVDGSTTVNLTGAQTVAGLKTFSGGLLSTSATQIIGYGAGAGGSVTQLTGKNITVTLHAPCGVIYTHNASLAAGASVSFSLVNNRIGPFSVLVPNMGGGLSYQVSVLSISTGSCNLRLTNISGGALAESMPIKFVVIAAVDA